MHTIEKQRGEQCWTVGYKAADCEWTPLRDFLSQEDAERFAHYLNGGDDSRKLFERLDELVSAILLLIQSQDD